MDLSEIKFYQVYKRGKRKPKQKVKGRKWSVTKSTQFEEKVKVIRMNATIINQKLQNY